MRPPLKIDIAKLEQLASKLHTQPEMAANLGISVDTIERRLRIPKFREAYERGRAAGCAQLRAKQFEMAMAGDKTMLVWLGKQYLGQRDNVDSIITGANGPIEISVSAREQLLGRLLGISARKSADRSDQRVNGD